MEPLVRDYIEKYIEARGGRIVRETFIGDFFKDRPGCIESEEDLVVGNLFIGYILYMDINGINYGHWDNT